jgi:uncharacterized membrane protein
MLVALGVGVLSISAVVFTLLFLVVQWASANLTPRLAMFRDDPMVWRTFAFTIAVFVFCLTAAVSIGRQETAPVAVAGTAVASALVAIALIRQLQLKAFASIQLAPVLATITAHGTQILNDLRIQSEDPVPPPAAPDASRETVTWPGPGRVLQQLQIQQLVAAAQAHSAMIVMRQPIGAFLLPASPLCDIHWGQMPSKTVLRAVVTGQEPMFGQDPLLAFRLLADIALRALSPAVNDPATTAQTLDRLHELYLQVAGHNLANGTIVGPDGHPRLSLMLPSFDDYLRVGLDDLIAAQSTPPLVRTRLSALLEDLHERATPAQRPTVAARLSQLGHRRVSSGSGGAVLG